MSYSKKSGGEKSQTKKGKTHHHTSPQKRVSRVDFGVASFFQPGGWRTFPAAGFMNLMWTLATHYKWLYRCSCVFFSTCNLTGILKALEGQHASLVAYLPQVASQRETPGLLTGFRLGKVEVARSGKRKTIEWWTSWGKLTSMLKITILWVIHPYMI